VHLSFLLYALIGISVAFSPITSPRLARTKHGAASLAQLPEGLVKTIAKEGNGMPVNDGDIATVKYSCAVPNSMPFSRSERQQMIVGDGSMIDGWDIVLQSMTIGERAVVRIKDPELGYGAAGFPPLIPPNAEIEIDVEVLDSERQRSLNLDEIMLDPSTPRTAADIAAAYDRLLAEKALQPPKKEGLEGFLEEAKNWYFFGLFEGETGQEAPWYLKPSITFPLAFLIVGATFYVCVIGGAITERGAQVTDELDEIILSWNAVATTITTIALANMDLGL